MDYCESLPLLISPRSTNRSFFSLSHFHLSSFLVERQLCQRLSGLTDHNRQVNLPRHRVRLVPEHFGVFFLLFSPCFNCSDGVSEPKSGAPTARGPQNLSVNKGLKESMRDFHCFHSWFSFFGVLRKTLEDFERRKKHKRDVSFADTD